MTKFRTIALLAFVASIGLNVFFLLRKPAVVTHEKLVPHRAPDSAFFGDYENAQGPFVMKYGDTHLTVMKHLWYIDSTGKLYITESSGYIREEQPGQPPMDFPLTIRDTQLYRSTMNVPMPTKDVPMVDLDRAPDSVFISSLAIEGMYSDVLWHRIRHEEIPYSFNMLDTVFTVKNRIYTFDFQAFPASAITTITGTRQRIGSTLTTPFTFAEKRYIYR